VRLFFIISKSSRVFNVEVLSSAPPSDFFLFLIFLNQLNKFIYLLLLH